MGAARESAGLHRDDLQPQGPSPASPVHTVLWMDKLPWGSLSVSRISSYPRRSNRDLRSREGQMAIYPRGPSSLLCHWLEHAPHTVVLRHTLLSSMSYQTHLDHRNLDPTQRAKG